MSGNRWLLSAALIALIVAPAQARSRWMVFSATAYSTEGQTASGHQTREGRTVAADPAVLPMGTKIQVRGAGPYSGTYLVQDTGRKIDGREIDIFIDSLAEAKKFGKKSVRVRILEKAKPAAEASAKKEAAR